jgi:peptide-methionine (S)-S-oxide reductase
MSQSQTITWRLLWCTEAVHVKVRGVTDVGYSNGQAAGPA